MNVPENFPRQPDPTALSGAHPKIAARLINGAYVGGYTPAEIETRYEVCADLVIQLTAYYQRKKSQTPERTHEQLLAQMAEALGQKNWGLNAAEIAWCMAEVKLAIESAQIGQVPSAHGKQAVTLFNNVDAEPPGLP